MSYVDHVIEHCTNFRVERAGGVAIFGPVDDSEAAMLHFQAIVRDLETHEGDGYAIHMLRRARGCPHELVDRVCVKFLGD